MTTRLEIINSMLAVNGEAPVSSTNSTDPAAIQASNLLNRIDTRVQSRGWYFNREDITLSPNLTGEVVLPQNTLSADPVDSQSQYVKRGSRLYDRGNNTYIISKDVRCTVVLQLDIEDLPEAASAFIEAKAVREYYRNEDGDAGTVRDLREDENESFAYLQRDNLANEDVNIRQSPMGLQLLRHTRGSNNDFIDRGA